MLAGSLAEEGVSLELARHRKATISDLDYHLYFRIPKNKEQCVTGTNRISFTLARPGEVILDFKADAAQVKAVSCNGKPCDYTFANEHIIIPAKYTQSGRNSVTVDFISGNGSLNRRDDYVYTLFVPDRARTAFPCFEQPNLKATYSLDLDIPQGWKVVSNGLETAKPTESDGYERHSTRLDTPIPTYLFAFAAGDFQYAAHEENGRRIGAYHRETDSLRIAQLPEIMHQVEFALEWQEDYTGMPYPFPKYDIVILPGFQFGGMEHVGATFYNDNVLFLAPNATEDERLSRTKTIAHETSHMWFGDAVTMDWFDDVWTKEVFANYFAAEITAPLFPAVNHELNWLKDYTTVAMGQDRTEGRTSIRQPLPNMRYAGLIYNDIIYNKAPVMMRKLVEITGKDAFRRGIRKYLASFKYGNATWPQLIDILDAETDADLKAFSRDWVDTANWPHFAAASIGDERIGREYGFCELSPAQIDSLLTAPRLQDDDAREFARWMTLNENYLAGNIGDNTWMEALLRRLADEKDALSASALVGYMAEPLLAPSVQGKYDTQLLALAASHELPAVRTRLLRTLAARAVEPVVVDSLYETWRRADSPLLSPNDYTTLAYELAVRLPAQADSILATQRTRITNPDRLAQFDFISPSVSPSAAVRDSVFRSLAEVANRSVEPWVRTMLTYLNLPLRQADAVKYIRPALDLLPEIQRTGDIFFPITWCKSLLAGHRSAAARAEVDRYLADNPALLPLLRNKVLEAAYPLTRQNRSQ